MRPGKYRVVVKLLGWSAISFFGVVIMAAISAYTLQSREQPEDKAAEVPPPMPSMSSDPVRVDSTSSLPGTATEAPATPPVAAVVSPTPPPAVATSPRLAETPLPLAPSANPVSAERPSVPPVRSAELPDSQPVASAEPAAQTANNAPSRPPVVMRSRSQNGRIQILPPEPESVAAPAPVPQTVEVRRAIPVTHPRNRNSTAAVANSASFPPPNPATQPATTTERRIVETMPDGRIRTTIIRTVRSSSGRGSTASLEPNAQ